MKQISWLKDKKRLISFLIFIILFVLSLDFWGWNQSNPKMLGLPIWVYYLILITVSLTLFFYILAKNIWRDD